LFVYGTRHTQSPLPLTSPHYNTRNYIYDDSDDGKHQIREMFTRHRSTSNKTLTKIKPKIIKQVINVKEYQ